MDSSSWRTVFASIRLQSLWMILILDSTIPTPHKKCLESLLSGARADHFVYNYGPHAGRLHCKDTIPKIHIFPEKELRGHSPNSYIHVPVCDFCIPKIGLHILLQQNGWTDRWNT